MRLESQFPVLLIAAVNFVLLFSFKDVATAYYDTEKGSKNIGEEGYSCFIL
jgi:hypothetical protein